MRVSAKLFAAMLVGLASAAFQSDSYAQSRGESRSSSVSRPANSSKPKSEARPSGSTSSDRKADISPANRKPADNKQSVSKPSANKPTTNKPAVNKPSANKPVANKPTSSKPADKPAVNKPGSNKPATKPSDKPSANKPASRPSDKPVVSRPVDKKPSQPSMDKKPSQPGVKPGNADRPIGVTPPSKYPRQPRVHPRDRDFMDYNKPTNHWSKTPHYYGYRIKSLPVLAKRHVYGGVTYYYYNDIWYRHYDGYYVVSRPPFGISLAANIISDIAWTAVQLSYYNAQVKALEAAQMANRIGVVQNYASETDSYFYQDGVFYVQGMDGQYYVIAPPAGAIVDRLPEDFDKIVLDGEDYFKVDDTIYKMVFDGGKPYFEVVGQMY